MHTIRNIIITFALLNLWGQIWSGLEILIYGYTENRAVDNIMTVLLIPILYTAVTKWFGP